MEDKRFTRLYILKTNEGENLALQEICEEYGIQTNGVFENAANFHRAWGFTENGLVYLSHTMFINNKIDFNSLNELVDYLDDFVVKN